VSWAPSPLRDVESLLESADPPPGGLSEREIEVLQLVAADMTNHAIATK
jgi:DNA-binding NarL/FixJ family response regulator